MRLRGGDDAGETIMWGDKEPVEVALVGGPYDGETRTEEKLKSRSDGWGAGSWISCFSGTVKPGETGGVMECPGSYGPPERDGDRWVRRFSPRSHSADASRENGD